MFHTYTPFQYDHNVHRIVGERNTRLDRKPVNQCGIQLKVDDWINLRYYVRCAKMRGFVNPPITVYYSRKIVFHKEMHKPNTFTTRSLEIEHRWKNSLVQAFRKRYIF